MRLINTASLEFKDFFGHEEKYAIISHCWGQEEVTYHDFFSDWTGPCEGHGWKKIIEGCRLAQEDSIQWLWIDTCCINKDSSAELTEAINSIYTWYNRAQCCYVFLDDVESGTQAEINDSEARGAEETKLKLHEDSIMREVGVFSNTSKKGAATRSLWHQRRLATFDSGQFKRAKWFTRGWTLQELLAPASVLFFSSEFEYIGEKEDHHEPTGALTSAIAGATGIPRDVLLKERNLRYVSVAERMKWAAQRTTSREEDLAYSLLGLFGVNMPLLYGEGGRTAFVRLQLEIIRRSDDESIFAWIADQNSGKTLSSWTGLLAPEPRSFDLQLPKQGTDFGEISERFRHFRSPYAMTNKGLELTLEISDTGSVIKKLHEAGEIRILLPLNCWLKLNGVFYWLMIALTAQVLQQQNHVLRGRRDRRLAYMLRSGKYCFFNEKIERYTSEFGAVVDGERYVTPWKVYFPQDGL